jgi:small subunit ribosomal protein S20
LFSKARAEKVNVTINFFPASPLLDSAGDKKRGARRLTFRLQSVYRPGPTGWAASRPIEVCANGDAVAEKGSGLMANTKSAQKAVRKIERRTAVNKSRRSEMRTFVRRVEEAIAAKDASGAATALRDAEPLVARAAQKGIMHKNAASRKISRLTKRVKALAS